MPDVNSSYLCVFCIKYATEWKPSESRNFHCNFMLCVILFIVDYVVINCCIYSLKTMVAFTSVIIIIFVCKTIKVSNKDSTENRRIL